MRISILAATGLTLAACNIGGRAESRDPGPDSSRDYSVANFERVEVSGPYDVTVTTGGETKVSASGGEKLLDQTDVLVEDGALVIRPKKQRGIHFNWTRGKAQFAVSTAALHGASIAGSGKIGVDKVDGDFTGKIGGSGSIDLAVMKGGNAMFSVAGSGDIRAAGTADEVTVKIGGSGDVDVAALAARDAVIKISGSGDVRANASETATIKIAGSGNVDVSGGAECTVSRAGGGKVNCH